MFTWGGRCSTTRDDYWGRFPKPSIDSPMSEAARATLSHSAANSSWTAELSRHHHSISAPMLQPIHLTGLQQMRVRVDWICCTFWSKCWTAEPSPPPCWAPMLRPIHVTGLQHMRSVWLESAGHSEANVGQLNCHHLQPPMSQLTCLTGSRQMHSVWLESAAHSEANVGQLSCHHHGVQPPMLRPIHLTGWQQTPHP